MEAATTSLCQFMFFVGCGQKVDLVSNGIRLCNAHPLHHAPIVLKKTLGEKKLNCAISLAQNGLYGKACQTLMSSGVAPNNDTWKLLISKCPHSPCSPVPQRPGAECKLPSDLNLMFILRSFPKLTAAGPSGLRIQHLTDATEVPLQIPLYNP